MSRPRPTWPYCPCRCSGSPNVALLTATKKSVSRLVSRCRGASRALVRNRAARSRIGPLPKVGSPPARSQNKAGRRLLQAHRATWRARPARSGLLVRLLPSGGSWRRPPRGRGRRGGRRRPGAAHDVEPAKAGGLLELLAQVVEQAGGGNRRLGRQPFDQPVHQHVGEPFDLGVDARDRLVRQHSVVATGTGHARINSSRRLLHVGASCVVIPGPGGRSGTLPGLKAARAWPRG